MIIRSFFILVINLLTVLNGITQEVVPSTIEHVIVYRSGATVTRTADAPLSSGVGQIILSGFSSTMDPNSIRVSIGQDIQVLSIYPLDPNEIVNKDTAVINYLTNLRLTVQSLDKELDLLNHNKSINGANNTLTPQQMDAYAAYYRERILKILQLKNNLNLKIIAAEKEHKKRPKNVLYYAIQYQAPSAHKAEVKIQYYDRSASWSTEYDLKLADITSDLTLPYKGLVLNQTDEDWNDIAISLSTGNPVRSITPPILSPWRLSPNPIIAHSQKSNLSKEANVRISQNRSDNFDMDSPVPDIAQISENVTALEFNIIHRVTIKKNSRQPYAIELKNNTIPTNLQYIAIPKLSHHAYLTAQIYNWRNYQLSQGNVNIFINGSYQGKSYLNPSTLASDTLAIPMGVDIGVQISRDKMNKYTERQWIRNKQELKTGWNISVANQKSYPIDIVVYDQLPISTDESITVEFIDISKAKTNKSKGELSWNLTLQPGQKETRKVIYKVKYPKDVILHNL